MPVVEAVRTAGNTTTGLGYQVAVESEMVVTVVACFPLELRRNLTVRLPVPEVRRAKNRIDGVDELTHSHGLRAVPPPGTSTEWLPPAPSSGLLSPETILAPFAHDQPLAPL